MFGLENRGETLIFMLRHFDETMTILISRFLHFGALKILTGDYFVLRLNKLIYSKNKQTKTHTHTHKKKQTKTKKKTKQKTKKKKKKRCFNHFSTFPSTFPTADFPIHYRVAYKWRIDRIIYQQVND